VEESNFFRVKFLSSQIGAPEECVTNTS
jgi:hypothetical protein